MARATARIDSSSRPVKKASAHATMRRRWASKAPRDDVPPVDALEQRRELHRRLRRHLARVRRLLGARVHRRGPHSEALVGPEAHDDLAEADAHRAEVLLRGGRGGELSAVGSGGGGGGALARWRAPTAAAAAAAAAAARARRRRGARGCRRGRRGRRRELEALVWEEGREGVARRLGQRAGEPHTSRRGAAASGSCWTSIVSVARSRSSAVASHVSARGRRTTDGAVRRASAKTCAHASCGVRLPSATSDGRSSEKVWQCSMVWRSAPATASCPLPAAPWRRRAAGGGSGSRRRQGRRRRAGGGGGAGAAEGGGARAAEPGAGGTDGGKSVARRRVAASSAPPRRGARWAGRGRDAAETERSAAGVSVASASSKWRGVTSIAPRRGGSARCSRRSEGRWSAGVQRGLRAERGGRRRRSRACAARGRRGRRAAAAASTPRCRS